MGDLISIWEKLKDFFENFSFRPARQFCRQLLLSPRRLRRNPKPMNPKSKPFLAVLLVLMLLGACKKGDLINSQNSKIETLPSVQTGVSVTVTENCKGYYQALPASYDSTNKKYPLILFIHGIGELGNGTTDLKNMARAGLPRLIAKQQFPPDFVAGGEHYSFIVVSPQFVKWPSNEDVKAVLDYSVSHYRVDASRIYITGLSMGGGVTWNYTAQFGNTVAASAPICGGSYPDEKRASSIASFDLPVWAFHNADDPVVNVSFSKDYITKINAHHPAVAAKVTVWPTGGHDSWTKAYDPAYKEDGKNVYEWMLQYAIKQ
jgi:predicted peptidase